MKTVKTDVTVKKGEFVNENGNKVEYIQLFAVIDGIELKFKPADGTTKQVCLAYLKRGN